MPAPLPFVAVVAGPTASGKTRLAIDLALQAGGEIVNADSQQVYRGLDVGTAKPTAAERSEVAHHLLDLVEPGEGMDAARWVALADAAIAGIAARGRLPIVVGGTGLYVRALLHGVVEAPGRDPALRTRLEEEAALHGRAALLDMARVLLAGGGWVVVPNRLEAAAAAGVDAEGDPRRLAVPFLERGARAVWLKGGHAGGDRVEDHWITPEGSTGLGPGPRLPGSPRGTGCTLASAWLAFRLGGAGDLPAAALAAAWLRARWGAAFAPGGLGRPVFAPAGVP